MPATERRAEKLKPTYRTPRREAEADLPYAAQSVKDQTTESGAHAHYRSATILHPAPSRRSVAAKLTGWRSVLPDELSYS